MADEFEEDQWVENREMLKKNVLPVERRDDPAELIEINARCFRVDESYIDDLVRNLLEDEDIPKTH